MLAIFSFYRATDCMLNFKREIRHKQVFRTISRLVIVRLFETAKKYIHNHKMYVILKKGIYRGAKEKYECLYNHKYII